MIFWWLLGCQAPTWTEAGALTPHRDRIDADHDGRVSAPEYQRTLWNGPPFASVDLDGDGDLSAVELVALVRASSPTTFDGAVVEAGGKRAGAGVIVPPAGERDVRELLVWMGDALRTTGCQVAGPEAIDAAARTGRLDSEETRAALGSMRDGWAAAGWSWPAGVP